MKALENSSSPNAMAQHGLFNPMNNFYRNDFMGLWNGNIPETLPAVNIKNRKEGMEIEVAIPGLRKEDLNVHVKGNSLVISSEKKTEISEKAGQESFFSREFNYSTFLRSVPLPEHTDSDKIEARYVNGILAIFVPKKTNTCETKNKKIKIY